MGAPQLKKKSKTRRSEPEKAPGLQARIRRLEEVGLVRQPDSHRWKLPCSLTKRGSPIQILALEVLLRREQLLIETITWRLNRQVWKTAARQAAKELFGSRTRIELHTGQDQTWLVIEFPHKAQRQTGKHQTAGEPATQHNMGFIALQLEIVPRLSGLGLNVSDVAAFGGLNPDLADKIPTLLRRTLGARWARPNKPIQKSPEDSGSPKRNRTDDRNYALACSVSVSEMLNIADAENLFDGSDHLNSNSHGEIHTDISSEMARDNTPVTSDSGFEADTYHLKWAAHIAAHPQKNRGPTIRRAIPTNDALPLLIRGERIEKNKNSIHPLSPLTALSINANADFNAGDFEASIDSISKLVRFMVNHWPQCEQSTTINSVFSEAIGDCWAGIESSEENEKDNYQLARSCWMKASRLRSNPTRIQEKIAGAARSRGYLNDELQAQEYLAAHEKRKDRLASILLRIAEIRTEIHPAGESTELILQATRLAPEDMKLKIKAFQAFVSSGLMEEAWDFGSNMLRNEGSKLPLESLVETALTLTEIAINERNDDNGASELLMMAHRAQPTNAGVMRRYAAVARKQNNFRVEQEWLKRIINLPEHYSDESENAAFRITTAHRSTITFACIRLIELYIDGQDMPPHDELTKIVRNTRYVSTTESGWEWFEKLTLIAISRPIERMTQVITTALDGLSKAKSEHGWRWRLDDGLESDIQKKSQLIYAFMAALATNQDPCFSRDLIAFCKNMFLDSRTTTKVDGPGWAKLNDAILSIVELAVSGAQNTDTSKSWQEWLRKNGEFVFDLTGPEHALSLAQVIAKSTKAELEPWEIHLIAKSIERAANTRIVATDKSDSINNNHKEISTDEARIQALLVKIVVTLASKSDNMDGKSAEVLSRAFAENPSLAVILIGDKTISEQKNETDFGDRTRTNLLVAAGLAMLLPTQPTTNSTIREGIIRNLERFSAYSKKDAVEQRLFESIIKEGQTAPLSPKELDFVKRREMLDLAPELFPCLVHQARIIIDEFESAELFKLCLEYAITQHNSEKMVTRILNSWLVRLNQGMMAPAKPEAKKTLQALAAELFEILREYDSARAREIAEQLAKAGFITPENPAPAICGALVNRRSDIADQLFKRAISSGVSGSYLVHEVYAGLRSTEISPGSLQLVTISEAIKKIVEWNRTIDPDSPLPPAIALQAIELKLDDDTVYSAIKSAIGTGARDDSVKLLWVPWFLQLTSRNQNSEAADFLARVLPEIRMNPDLLADFPFTVEWLEEEEKRLRLESSGETTGSDNTEIVTPEKSNPDNHRAVDDHYVFESDTEIAIEIDNDSRIEIDSDAQTAQGDDVTANLPDISSEPEASMTDIAWEPGPSQVSEETFSDQSDTQEILTEDPTEYPAEFENPTPTDTRSPEIDSEYSIEIPNADLQIEDFPEQQEQQEQPEQVEQPKQATEPKLLEQAQESGQSAEDTVIDYMPADFAGNAEATHIGSDDRLDWRSVIRDRKYTQLSTTDFLEASFPNKLEQHIAVQAIAVLRGECHSLEKWDWRVWRKINEYQYNRNGKSRFPTGMSPRNMKTPEFKMLLKVSSALIRAFPEKFSLGGLAKSIGITQRQIASNRRRLDWSTGLPGYAGFTYYAKTFSASRLQIYSLRGIGPQIFMDIGTATVYVDDEYYSRKPQTHLFHRVMFQFYALKMQFFPFLMLDASKQILHEVNSMKGLIEKGGVQILAAKLGLGHSRLAKSMTSGEIEEFSTFMKKAAPLSEDDIIDAQKSMQQYIWRLMLADTLDLIGITEALLDIDLLLPGSIKTGEVLLMSPQIDPLINFALALKMD